MQICPTLRPGASGWTGLVSVLVAAAVTVLVAAPAEARIEIKTGADGRRIISSAPSYSGGSYRMRAIDVASELSYLIDRHARAQGLAPKLVQAVIQVESGYNHRARSSKGAMGLMQLMPGTARMLGVRDPYDPEQNVRGGTVYLRRQLDRFAGDLTLALAAYNAGPAAVARYGGVPPYRETRNYVRKVLGLYRGTPSAVVPAPRPVRKAAAPRAAPRGKKIYVRRGANNRISVTTAPPGRD